MPARIFRSVSLLACLGLTSAVPAPKTRTETRAKDLVVVELYQSQGCSSCPPANALLNALSARGDILSLSFAVTYWDSLGWKDTFAKPEFTQRQWDFARLNGRSLVATPQFVVEGSDIVSGSDPAALRAAIAEASHRETAVTISARGGRILVAAGAAHRPSTVWLVRFDPRERFVSIGSGENAGRQLPHRNVVTGLRALGSWRGEQTSFVQPPYIDPQQRSAVFIQEGTGGPILAAMRL